MILTVKSSLVRSNRVILIGGTAILGVATAKLVGDISAQSFLLALAAVCLMYVGEVGRSASERVARLLPQDATPDVVKSTQAHNLGDRRRTNIVLTAMAIALVCLVGAVAVSSTAGSASHSAERRRESGLSAPAAYRPGARPLPIGISCRTSCGVTIRPGIKSGSAPISQFSLPGGRTEIKLSATAVSQAMKHSSDAGSPVIVVRVSPAGQAALQAAVRISSTRG